VLVVALPDWTLLGSLSKRMIASIWRDALASGTSSFPPSEFSLTVASLLSFDLPDRRAMATRNMFRSGRQNASS
jgi:hypothetical protein